MKNLSRLIVLFTGLVILMSTTLFVSCSTMPVVPLASNQVNYTILGPVTGGPWDDQVEALKVAKEAYPDADAVIAITAKADNDFIPKKITVGYYAIKFNQQVESIPEKKGFLGT